MGVKSTHQIKRQTAIQIILFEINNASNEELGYMLECFEEQSQFRNYDVMDDQKDFFPGLKIENTSEW